MHMQRQDILREVKDSFGFVPGFLEHMHDQALDQWWSTSKNFWTVETSLPVKTKMLIGLASAASIRCRY